MKIFLIGILAIIEKELKQLFRNKLLVAMIIIIPIFAVLVLTRIYSFDLKNVNIAVVDADHSQLSARLTDGLDRSAKVTLSERCTTYDEAFDFMEKGNIDCIVLFPKGLESSYYSSNREFSNREFSNREKVQLSVKAVDVTKGILGTKLIKASILSSISKYFTSQGIDLQLEEDVIREINLYNPTMDYVLFMVSVALLSIAFVICCNTSVSAMFNEEISGISELMNASPLGPGAIVMAKILSCYIAGLISMVIALVCSYFVYGTPEIQSFGLIFIVYSLYILGVPAFAVFVNNLTSNPMQAFLIITAFLMISQYMSGFLTPSESMVEWMQKLNVINPAHYLVVSLRSIYMKGAELTDLLRPLAVMAVQCGVLWYLAVCTFRKIQK